MKAVIFDWGGVLMRTIDRSPRHTWDERLGLPRGSVEKTVHGIEQWQQVQRGQLSLNAYWQGVASELTLSPVQLQELKADFYSGDELNTPLVVFIRELRERSVPVGLMSNNSPDLPDTMSQLGVDHLFDAVVISCEIGVMKPAPAAYHAILDALSLHPSQAIFIDDFPENVAGARAVGMSALHFTPGADVQLQINHWLAESNDD